MNEFRHRSVLFDETIEMLNVKPSGIYVDGTIGGAGHSFGIAAKMNESGLLIGIDQDQNAINAAEARLHGVKPQIKLFRKNFECIGEILEHLGIAEVDGILLDLGVSSPQLDESERGFSYRNDAPLDMRMDQSKPFSASHLVNSAEEAELSKIFWEYGEERWAKRIAQFIVNYRRDKEITTTSELAEIIKNAIPAAARRNGPHPARRIFQALRIAVNDELGVLERVLGQAADALAPQGRLAIISFHSLEDRIVKDFYVEQAQGCICSKKIPVCQCHRKPKMKIITRKPIVAGEKELEENPRSRSAKLRVAEKLA